MRCWSRCRAVHVEVLDRHWPSPHCVHPPLRLILSDVAARHPRTSQVHWEGGGMETRAPGTVFRPVGKKGPTESHVRVEHQLTQWLMHCCCIYWSEAWQQFSGQTLFQQQRLAPQTTCRAHLSRERTPTIGYRGEGLAMGSAERRGQAYRTFVTSKCQTCHGWCEGVDGVQVSRELLCVGGETVKRFIVHVRPSSNNKQADDHLSRVC